MSIGLCTAIELTRANEKLRCHLPAGGADGRRVKAKLVRRGRVVEQNVFVFDPSVPIAAVAARVESAMREIARAAGGRLRVLVAGR